ncbi:MAG: LysR family transcriptional regulator [Pseudomonadota bacterium]
MDARHLVQLAVAIDLGSFTRAAQRLNITQPTLSRNIKAIEDRVGAPVVLRQSSGVIATDIGERLAERGRAILSESEQADDVVRQWREGMTTELRLGIGPLLAATFVPSLVARAMAERWPYTLKLTSASAAPLIRRLNDNRLDVVLAPAQLRLHQESLTQTVVFPDRLVIIAGARSKLARDGAEVTREALEQARWVISGARAGIHGTEMEIFRHLGIEPKRVNLSVSGDLMVPLHLLRTTDVLAALPERLFPLMGDQGGARILDADYPEIRRDIALWVRKTDQYRTEFLHFQQALEKHLKRFEGGAGPQ